MDHEKAIKNVYCELSKTYDVLGVFLTVAPNVLKTLSGELFIKAVVVPSFEDLIFKKPVKATFSSKGMSCDVEDIRIVVRALKEQDQSAVGCLFSKCYFINPRYRVFYAPLEGMKEQIAHMNEVQTIDRMYASLACAKKTLPDEDKNTMDTATVGYHKESFMTVWKMARMIERYAASADYEDVLDDSFLFKLANSQVDVVKAFSLVNQLDKTSRETISSFVASGAKAPDVEAAAQLDHWMEDVLKDKYRIGELQV